MLLLSDPFTLAFFQQHPELCPEEVMKQSIALLQSVMAASPPVQPPSSLARFRSSVAVPTQLETAVSQQFPTSSMETVYTKNVRFLKISRVGLPQDILVLEHEAEANATEDTVDLFVQAVSSRPHCHGLFVAQRAGICGRANFSHEVLEGGHVAVFIHRCDHDADRVRAGIDMIDALLSRADLLGSESFAQTLTEEYRRLHVNRVALRDLAQTLPKRIGALVDLMQLPSLDAELSRCISVHTCTVCGYSTTTPGSLEKHLRNKKCRGKSISTLHPTKKQKTID